jgi:hypothetical protein
MGIFNSSETRVRPILGELLGRNGADASWTLQLWNLARSPEAAPSPSDAGQLTSNQLSVDPRTGLLRVFERPVPPPSAFLRWLILNPDRMTGPDTETFGTSEDSLAREHRRDLFSLDSDTREAAQKAAVSELDRLGSQGSGRKWRAFEGFTHADCCLETDTLLLLIEGKRTEPVSSSTRWFAQRSQLWRNVEAAKELANGRAFGVIVTVEQDADGVLEDARRTRDGSLPHLSAEMHEALSAHLLGATTWAQIVTEFDLPTRLLR